MDTATQTRWDAHYHDAEAPGAVTRVVAENLHLLPLQGLALDLACGLGGNTVPLARRGLTCHAWDISQVAISKLNAYAAREKLSIIADIRDVFVQPLPAATYDVIVVTRFLDRRLTSQLIAGLRPGGLLLYQTFTRLRQGDAGPQQEEWRLADGELLTMFPELVPLVYREERLAGDTTQGLRDEALLVAQKRI